MTDQTPIERAALAIEEAESHGRVVPTFELAQIAYEAIDTEQLAGVIAKHYGTGYRWDTGTECDCGEHLAGRDERYQDNHESHIAQAVKNWLTGKGDE